MICAAIWARSAADPGRAANFAGAKILAPIGGQEVWAAGVTYYRSRDARMAESKDAGGGDFYDRVYSAERPELFFKATANRVAAPDEAVRIRSDAKWSVPEPELTLVINPRGQIIGYTIGNDMSSRDIEGENPLYLPQAKVYDRSMRAGAVRAGGERAAAAIDGYPHRDRACRQDRVLPVPRAWRELKRKPELLVEYLFRDNLLSPLAPIS